MQNEVDKPTRLLRFVALVHFLFFFSVSQPFCSFTLVYEGHFVLCCILYCVVLSFSTDCYVLVFLLFSYLFHLLFFIVYMVKNYLFCSLFP